MAQAHCASYGADTMMRCDACKDAPEYRLGVPIGVIYCGRDCQKAHWSTHKPYCHTLRQRKKLLRVATVLRATLLAYREVRYDVDLTKMEFTDGLLRLHRRSRNFTDRKRVGPFPDHLTTSIDHKEAALVHNYDAKALSLLSHLTRMLLEGQTHLQCYDFHKLK